jgi:RNA polymerase sigma-70 factor (ECF subfamily)
MAADTLIDTLVRRHQAGLWRYLRFLGADGATADDLVQETFLVLLTGAFEERSPRETDAWLRLKAKRLWLDGLRRRRRRREARLADVADEVWEEYAGDDGGDSYRAALRECLASLPERSRRALALRYEDRVSRGEMARRLHLKQNGVKTLLQRVRAGLRECVTRRLRR